MRKITSEAVRAFENNQNYKNSNTEVNSFGYFLHGNRIAYKDGDKVYISNCGWQSNTTKERLNGLRGVKITQKDFVWYLNGKEWNGQYIAII